MKMRHCIIVITLTNFFSTVLTTTETYPSFPNDFTFGVGTSAYQIEGGWNASGKSENFWDHLTHNYPSAIEDNSSADIACDSYHKIDDDIQIIHNLGVDSYRFSLSWSRILPDGFSNRINPDGIRYYNELIDKLLSNNIVPFVTLYHSDTPHNLQMLGGWTNDRMVDYFADYAKVAFNAFGDRVKLWTTFNEPKNFCKRAIWSGLTTIVAEKATAPYLCAYTVLKAHAKAYNVYKNEFAHQNGKLGIILDLNWAEPLTGDKKDSDAANRIREFEFGLYANPIFSLEGDFPKLVKERVENISRLQNFPQSRLPVFTPDEITSIRGSTDFLGFNHYTTRLISDDSENINTIIPSMDNDVGVNSTVDPSWPTSEINWLYDVPWGFYKALMYIKNKYNNPPIYITENGFCENVQDDQGRIKFFQGYLKSLSDAISEGCNILGYYAWSLMDNFEWYNGFTKKFGFYEVNFIDPNRPRTPRASVKWYKDFIFNVKSNNKQ